MSFSETEEISLYDCGDHVEIDFCCAGIWPFEWSDGDLGRTAAERLVRRIEEPLRALGAVNKFNDEERSERFHALLKQKDVWVSFPPDLVTMNVIRQVRKLILRAREDAEQSVGLAPRNSIGREAPHSD